MSEIEKTEYVNNKILEGIEEEKNWLREIHNAGQARALITLLDFEISSSDLIQGLIHDTPIKRTSLGSLKACFGSCLGVVLYDLYTQRGK